MSSTPREIGTLIIVIDQANHLPNKRHIGKQDPYCAIEFEGRKGRTKTIKRGGQHPVWDEELRFPVFEDVEDELARTATEDRAPSPPPKDGSLAKPDSLKSKKSTRSKRAMKVACWADDARDPELIGETMVDLTTVLTKGEQDEWHSLTHKEKFAGKVYLELTFYSNEEPPPKASKASTMQTRPDYAGPGDFIGEPKKANGQPRTVSTPHRVSRESRTSMRNPSGSFIELYTPPYDPAANMPNDFGQMSISHHTRRESFPPVNNQHTGNQMYPPRHSISMPMPDGQQGYESSISESASTYSNMSYQSYQAPYDASATPAPSMVKPSARGPRYSVPTSSSGFMPLAPSRALPSYPSEPSGFAPSSMYTSDTPAPYSSQYAVPISYTPMPPSHSPLPPPHSPLLPQAHTPMPPQTPMPPSVSGILPYQQYSYSHYPLPPQQYSHTPPQAHNQSLPQRYSPYPGTPSPPNEPSLPISSSTSLNSSHGSGGSRPLPTPHQAAGVQYPPPMPEPGQPYDYVNGNGVTFPTSYPPPPPPLTNGASPSRSPHQHSPHPPHQSYQEVEHLQQPYRDTGSILTPPPPPPPPPPSTHVLPAPPPPPPLPLTQYESPSARRRNSLPQPPSTTPSRGALPTPPQMPPGSHIGQHPLPQPPSHFGISAAQSLGQIPPPPPLGYAPVPPPRPPQMDGDGHWVPPPPPLQRQYGWA